MDPGPARDALTLLAGVATGVLSGAFGVGGAVIATPAIRALGVPALLAVGTTLPSILPSAVSGTARFWRDRLIDWWVVRWTAPAGVAASVVGSVLSRAVPGEGHLLMILTALLLGFSAVRMAVGRQPDTCASPGVAGAHRRAVLVAVGVVAGLLSGLLGVGGGVVLVPGFTHAAAVPLKPAIATSLACVGILAVPGTVAHGLLGGIDWRFAFLLALGVVPGARLGAAATVRAGERRLRLAVAAFLAVIAVVYLWGEVAALTEG
jgi:uncharacterized membrane protein YfcA